MRVPVCAFVLAACVSAAAEEEAPPPLVSGEMGASWLANSGNTNNSTVGTWGQLAIQPGPYKAIAQGGFIQSTVEQATSSRRAYAGLRGERKLPASLSAEVRGEYYEDRPAGTRKQYAVSAGGLCRILANDTRTLSVSVSLTHTWERRVLPPDRDFLGAQTGLEFSLKVNDIVALTHESSYVRDFSDATNWRGKASTSLQASLNRHFAFKVAHQLYRNKPDPGKHAVDMGIVASLVASWPAKPKP